MNCCGPWQTEYFCGSMMENSVSEKEVAALISLLDDPDDGVFQSVRQRLQGFGTSVVPFLERAWESSFDSVLQQRIEELIHHIQFEQLSLRLEGWFDDGGQDLLEGVLLVNRYQYPDLDEEKMRDQLNALRNSIWLEINPNLTALELIRVFNHMLFEVHGFMGNTTNYHAPQNSWLNHLLESKKGNPLMLSILYLWLAQQLDVPVYGINLPEHFVLAYMQDQEEPAPDAKSRQVLFYINPFSKGTVFSRKEIDAFIKQLKLPYDPAYYEPCTNADMVRRLIRNLMLSFDKLGYKEKSEELKLLLNKSFKA